MAARIACGLLQHCFTRNLLQSRIPLTSTISPRILLHTTCAAPQKPGSRLDNPDYATRTDIVIPKDETSFGRLIYDGSIKKQVLAAKRISLASTMAGFAAQPAVFRVIEPYHVVLKAFVGTFLGFFVYLTPFLLHYVAKRYVMRLYLDDDTKQFTAVVPRFLPIRRMINFTRDEVRVPLAPGMFTTHLIERDGKVIPLFLHGEDFLDVEAYKYLMRYDEPIDFLKSADEYDKKPASKR